MVINARYLLLHVLDCLRDVFRTGRQEHIKLRRENFGVLLKENCEKRQPEKQSKVLGWLESHVIFHLDISHFLFSSLFSSFVMVLK